MKKLLTLTLMLICCLSGFGQKAEGTLYFSENPNALIYTLPRTSLKISLVVEKETIRKGPYARFAQRYLGVIAPLADKDLYTLKGASIEALTESDPNQVYVVNSTNTTLQNLIKQQGRLPMPVESVQSKDRLTDNQSTGTYDFIGLGASELVPGARMVSKVYSDTSFVKITPDRMSVQEQSPEQMAYMAAEAIFTIRKKRMDLITGDAGENVFGSGLKAAIDELTRLEDEYISLFLGKQTVQQIVEQVELMPSSDKSTYIVCRFSPTEGVVSATNLSGQPLVLELKAEAKSELSNLPRKPAKYEGELFKYRVAEMASCRLLDGSLELFNKRLPIYQFGEIVDIPVK